jgi:hypothetical protein
MRRAPLGLLLALGACGPEDPYEGGELVTFSRRVDGVGDRYEVEIRSRSGEVRSEGGEIDTSSLSAVKTYTDEVARAEEGRATLVRRTFHTAGKDLDGGELDPRAAKGSGRLRTDHFRQFERLVPTRARVGERWVADGALGIPPSDVLRVDDAAWLNSRCACSLRELSRGGRDAVVDVTIDLDGGGGPSRLQGTLRFDLEAGLLRDVDLRGQQGDRTVELHGTQTVVPGNGQPAVPK